MSITTAVIALIDDANHSISDNAASINWTQELQTMNDSLDALKINLNHFYLCSFAILTICNYQIKFQIIDNILIVMISLYHKVIPIGITFMDIGLVRTKSSADLLLKTTIDFRIIMFITLSKCINKYSIYMKFPVIGSLVYWLFGYAWAWGDGNAFIGFTNFAFAYLDPEKVPSALFHVVSSPITVGY